MRVASSLSSARALPALPVADYERAEEFYEEVLGFTLTRCHRFPHGTSIVAAGDGTAILLYERDEKDPDRAVAVFFVEDVSGVVHNLEMRGVRFEEFESPNLDAVNDELIQDGAAPVWFRDSEDNILGVVQDWREWS